MVWTCCITCPAASCFYCRTQKAGSGVPPSGTKLVLLPIPAGCRAWCCDAGVGIQGDSSSLLPKDVESRSAGCFRKGLDNYERRNPVMAIGTYWSACWSLIHPLGSRLVGVRRVWWGRTLHIRLASKCLILSAVRNVIPG